MQENIYLVGPMGAGKTTVGRCLAGLLGCRFLDSDKVIVERAGLTIPQIFDQLGEAHFRALESRVLDELTQLPGVVLATGGGAILSPVNRAFLVTRGVTVYLYCPVDIQVSRTGQSANRPLLQCADPRSKLESLMRVRDPLYRETAELVIESSAGNVEKIAERILISLRNGVSEDHLASRVV